MTQNIYDDDEFFEGYSHLPRSVKGLDGAPEWASLKAMLPDMKAKRVLDLGCGFGWYCRFAAQAGAASVLGLDVSEKMLARARTETKDAAVAYERTDLETLTLKPGAFDLIYSSLAFHYIEKLDRLFAAVHEALTPGGAFVFSVEHPVFTAPLKPGWAASGGGRKGWIVDSYQTEGARLRDWLGSSGVVKQHRTLGAYLNALIARGFAIVHVEEWGPTDAQVAANPALAEERERPMFLLVGARK